MRITLLAALAVVCGCSIEPPEGIFSCDDDSDCPDEWTCAPAEGEMRCFSAVGDAGMDAADAMPDTTPDTTPADASVADADGGDAGVPPFLVTFGGLEADIGEAVAVDDTGNVYAVGSFRGTVDFGGDTRTASGATDAFIASYTPVGALRFVRTFGATGGDVLRDIAQRAGGFCVAGTVVGGVDVGGGSLGVPVGARSALVACYDGNGDFEWARAIAGSEGRGVAASAAGVALTGSFSDPIDVDGDVLNSAGDDDVFVATYSPEGVNDLALSAGGTELDQGWDVGLDDTGRVVSVGRETNVDLQAFLRRYQTTGAVRSDTPFDNTGADYFSSVATEGVTSCAAGVVSGRTDFGGTNGVVDPPIGGDAFVACFGTTAIETRWARGFPATSTGIAHAVDLVGDDVWAAGEFREAIDVGATGTATASAGERDAFAAQLSLTTAMPVRTFTFGGPGDDQIRGVAIHREGAYVVGSFNDTAALVDGMRTSQGATDVFILFLR